MKYIMDIGIVVTLVILIVIRLVVDEGPWMVGIQYIGLMIAIIDLTYNVLSIMKQSRHFKKFLIISLVIIIFSIVPSILGSLGLVKTFADTKAMDIISLITLMISLPQNFYLKLLEEKNNEEW